MRNVQRNFLRILAIEIDDFKEDLEVLIEECESARKCGRLSESVFWENITVFNNEILGVKSFHHILEKINPDDFKTLDDLMEEIKSLFRQLVKECGLVEAINIYVERKMDKVARYVRQ
ncbi:hypothetical protein JW835_12440 [bacterium]|nr:hypothetical protein [bacterium]